VNLRRFLVAANLLGLGFLLGVVAGRLPPGAAEPTCGETPALPPGQLVMLYDGQRGNGRVDIGLAASSDDGQTWARAGCPVFVRGSEGSWETAQVHAPQLVWDGSRWAMFYDGYDGRAYRIGRATSSNLLTWNREASNPIVSLGPGGSPDEHQAIAPQVLFEPDRSPAWRMWYTGEADDGLYRLLYAESRDGIHWVKHGVVIDAGGPGTFDRFGASSDITIRVDDVYYVFYAGQGALTGRTRPGVATTTTPAIASSYRKLGSLQGLAGDLMIAGKVYDTNGLTTVIQAAGLWVGYGTAIGPLDGSHHSISYRTTSTDLLTWTTPVGPLVALTPGAWDGASAGNPTVRPRSGP
jgi:hypothetical protein